MREIHDQPDRDVGRADRNSVDAGRDAPGGPDRLQEAGCRAVVRDAPDRMALSLDPDHPGNNGKADGWRALGYGVDSRQARSEAAEDIRELIRDGLLVNGKVAETRDSPFGPKYTVLSGFTGPNGRHGTLITCWLGELRRYGSGQGDAACNVVEVWCAGDDLADD